MHQAHTVRVLSAVQHEYISSLYPEILSTDCFASEWRTDTLPLFYTIFCSFKLRSERRERPVDTSRTLDRAPDTESILSQSPTLEGQGVGPLISSSGRQTGRQSVVNQSHLCSRPLWFQQHNTEIPRVSLSKNSGLFFFTHSKVKTAEHQATFWMTAAAITESAWQKVLQLYRPATADYRCRWVSDQQGQKYTVCHLATVNMFCFYVLYAKKCLFGQ